MCFSEQQWLTVNSANLLVVYSCIYYQTEQKQSAKRQIPNIPWILASKSEEFSTFLYFMW